MGTNRKIARAAAWCAAIFLILSFGVLGWNHRPISPELSRHGQSIMIDGVTSLFGVKDTGAKNNDGKPVYDFTERADYVDRVLMKWFENGTSTATLYKNNGKWNPVRRQQQLELMEEIWNESASNVPNNGKSIISGGLGGAGKSYTLENIVKVDPSEYFTINPDLIKEKMAEKDMIPNLDPKLTPMELSPLAHTEASEMAYELAIRAYREKKNVVWDITMSSKASVANGRVKLMRAAGYREINAVFVDVTVEKSIRQARTRWSNGLIAFAQGVGYGGRFLPSGAAGENLPTPGAPWRSKNREVFEAVKTLFDGYKVYDNEIDDQSTLVESKGDW
ncbi:MAG: zeta toxin family protein [Mycobacterium sp.]